MSESDSHKTRRVYHSAAEKRRQVKERCEKEEAVVSKTQRMTEFLIGLPQQSQPHALISVSESKGQEVGISVGEKNVSDEEDETVVIFNQSISQDECITDVSLWPDKPSRELIDKWALEGSVR